jgi:transcription elongation factor GreA
MRKTAKNIVYLSPEGLAAAQAELERLLNVDRSRVIGELTIAKEFGNLDENADYESARNEQSFIEGRIAELNALIREARIIDPPKSNRKVVVGSTVEMTCEDGPVTYTIVGHTEADPAAGKISNESPLAQEILGKSVGDKVTVEAPGGCFEYAITRIE